MDSPKALEGVRIIVAEDFVVLPFGTMMLGDLGAEVIRVEAPTRLVSRRFTPFPDGIPGKEWWNETGWFHYWFRNKRSAVINIQTPQGRELFRDLVKVSDVVATNFRTDVVKRLGLDYESLREVKPDLVMINVTGFGQTGPWRNYGAFARTIDGYTGLSHLTGYIGGPPLRANPTYMDTTGGMNNFQAIMMGLFHRDSTGQGIHIDASMYEAGISAVGPALLNEQKTGQSPPRAGNRHSWMAPHGCYPCKGDDRWVVIAVNSDEAWRATREAMGNPAWAQDPRFDSMKGRWEHQDEMDPHIAEWTSQRDSYEVFHLLQKAGVAAGPVLNGKDLLLDPQLQDVGVFDKFTHDEERVGTRIYQGRPYQMSRTPGSIDFVSTFGEDNHYVLSELLGLGDAELQSLLEQGVIANDPDEEEKEPPPSADPAAQLRRHALQLYDQDYKAILGLEDPVSSGDDG